jgi:formate hydrogenlyase subunit 6/NADH:ubiquinone oxidoreductase subunit I
VANLEPKKNALANTEAVPVENTGPASLLQQAKGFWVTFSKQFQKKLTYNYPEATGRTTVPWSPSTKSPPRWFREMYWLRTLRLGLPCRCNLC